MTQEQFDQLATSCVIDRFDLGKKQTLGLLDLLVNGDPVFNCKTLELPWKDNALRISCIPEGFYLVEKHNSPTFGKCFIVKSIGKDQVEGRTWILIHPANFHTDLLGCIGVGRHHTDINGDGLRDVTHSKATLKEFLALAPDSFYLQIMN